MNKKFMIMALFIISLLAVSAVSAEDNSTFDVLNAEDQNEEIIYASDNISVCDDNNTLTVSPEDSFENSYDENISVQESDAVLENDGESPLYGIVDIGANSMKLEIYKIKDSGKPKSVLSLSEKSVTSIYL